METMRLHQVERIALRGMLNISLKMFLSLLTSYLILVQWYTIQRHLVTLAMVRLGSKECCMIISRNRQNEVIK
jgi:hypothetical protein